MTRAVRHLAIATLEMIGGGTIRCSCDWTSCIEIFIYFMSAIALYAISRSVCSLIPIHCCHKLVSSALQVLEL